MTLPTGTAPLDYGHDEYREALEIQFRVNGPSPRPLEVLQGVADGFTLSEIAEASGTKLETVTCQMDTVCSAFCARTRPAAVYAALSLGLLWIDYPDGERGSERGLSTGSVSANGIAFNGDHDQELIYMLAQGFRTGEMRQATGYAHSGAVAFRFRQIRKKLGAGKTRESIVRRAYELGLIDPHNGGPPDSPPFWEG